MLRFHLSVLVISGLAALGACGQGGSEEPAECEAIQCFRAVECVAECGGPILSSGCCPCPEGSFDSISCPAETPGER